MRVGLLAAFALHLHAAFTLDRRNRQASRRARYVNQQFTAASYASRTMLWSGIIVGLFIIFHIADLTWGATNEDFVHGDAYNNQIASFSNPLITAVYLFALIALVAHLRHGLASLVQSLGSRIAWLTESLRDRVALGLSVLIGLGYASIPLAVQFGILDYASAS